MSRCVWAYKPLAELKNATGFVECDDELAAELLASGAVQDPQIGATALNEIEAAPPAPAPDVAADEYDTKVVTPKKPRR